MDLNGLLSSHLVHPCKRIKQSLGRFERRLFKHLALSLTETRRLVIIQLQKLLKTKKLLCLLRKGSPLVSAFIGLSLRISAFNDLYQYVKTVMLVHLVVELHVRLLTYSPQTIPKTSYLVENFVLSHELCDT